MRWMALLAFLCASARFAQSEPRFEVASVRLADPSESRTVQPIETGPGSLTVRGMSLFACLQWAYQMPVNTVAPEWLRDVRLDIVAKAASPVGDAELFLMLRTLLHDRMGVAAHMEKREMASFALTIAKQGAKLTESNTDGPPDFRGASGVMIAQRMAMSDLAKMLTMSFRRPVVDATGLKGRYDFRIDGTRYLQPADGTAPSQAELAGAVISALREELGIQVEDRKALVDTLVVETAERVPTDN